VAASSAGMFGRALAIPVIVSAYIFEFVLGLPANSYPEWRFTFSTEWVANPSINSKFFMDTLRISKGGEFK
jgi:hypothetical protein